MQDFFGKACSLCKRACLEVMTEELQEALGLELPEVVSDHDDRNSQGSADGVRSSASCSF